MSGRKAIIEMIFPARIRNVVSALPLWVLTTSVAIVPLVVVPARSAFAQDQAAIEKLVQLNKKAMDDYDTADFDTAKKSLLEAEKLGKRAGLEGHPIMARTYVHLGALFVTGYKDKRKAEHYFSKALDIQGDINLDRNLVAPSVRDLFASVKAHKAEPESAAAAARADAAEDLFPPSAKSGPKKGRAAAEPTDEPAGASGGGTAMPPDAEGGPESPRRRRVKRDSELVGEPDLPTTITALDCPYPDDTPPGKKVTLRCVAAANLGVAKVVLFFKGFEMTDYQQTAMTRSPKGWWQATVPKKRVDGTSLQFYFEGLDASDKPVVSNGRGESPNVMLIVERENQAAASAGDAEENPLEESGRSAPRLRLGKRDDSREGLDTHFGNRRFWVGIGLGTGLTYAIDGTPESRVCGLNSTARPVPCVAERPDVVVSGIGWAGLGQLVPEIGYHINPDWAVSIESRHQYIYQPKKVAGYTASGAHAALLKVIRYTKQQRTRLFFAVAGGGGEGVRMNIQTDTGQNKELTDTVLIGGVLLGGTVGINYEISKKMSWIAEVNVLFGFPKKGGVADFNTALQFNFGDTSGAAEAAAAKRATSVSGSIDDEEPK